MDSLSLHTLVVCVFIASGAEFFVGGFVLDTFKFRALAAPLRLAFLGALVKLLRKVRLGAFAVSVSPAFRAEFSVRGFGFGARQLFAPTFGITAFRA